MSELYFEVIKPASSTTATRKAQEKVMCRGNRILSKYHKRIKAKLGRYSLSRFRRELFAALRDGEYTVQGFRILRKHLPPILAVRELEAEIMATYSRQICKTARRWANSHSDSGLGFDDYYNEGVMGCQNAIYSYTKNKVRFHTYLVNVLDRWMLNVDNKAKPTSPWTQHNKKLFGQFKELSLMHPTANFDEIATEMLGLEGDDLSDLRCMVQKVVPQSVFKDRRSELSDRGNESGIDALQSRESFGSDGREFLEAALKLDLSDWERDVLNGFLYGGRGWQTEVADKHINPDTGSSYSRRAPKLVMDRIVARLKEQLRIPEAA